MIEQTDAGTASPLQQAAREHGATFTEVAGHAVPRHFGDSAAEYRAVRERVGLAARSDRAQIRVWGKDPVRMVQGLITNDLAGAPPGRAVYAAMLTPKGRMITDLRAFRREGADGPEVMLDLSREALAGTTEHLRKFVPPMFARWADISDQIGQIGIYGPGAHDAVAVLFPDAPALQEDEVWQGRLEGAPVHLLGTREFGPDPGFDLFAGAEVLPALWSRLRSAGAGVRPVGLGALETLRIEAGRPRYGAELSDETIPTEAWESSGLMDRGISFTKGCYTGQEVIVRIAHRGHVNRHLRGLRLGESAAPAPGATLYHPDTRKEVGRITSVAASPLLGETIALGYVRREIGPGGSVRVGSADGGAGIVAELPFTRGSE